MDSLVAGMSSMISPVENGCCGAGAGENDLQHDSGVIEADFLEPSDGSSPEQEQAYESS